MTSYFFLAPGLGMPRRFRTYDGTVSHSFTRQYFHGQTPQAPPVTMTYKSGRISYIWDEVGDRERLTPEEKQWRNCVHDTYEYSAGPKATRWTIGDWCNHNDWYQYTGDPVYSVPGDLQVLLHWGDIINTEQVQAIFQEVSQEWNRKLYQFRPEQLPDMAVFMVELREMAGIFGILWDVAQALVGLAKKHSLLVRTLDREIKILHRFERVGNRRKIEDQRRKLKSIRASIRELAKLRLSYNFGVRAPLNDLTKIVASFWNYLDHMQFEPTHEKIRKTAEFDIIESCDPPTGCHGLNCNRLAAERLTTKKVHVRATLTHNVVYQNRLKGSVAEKALYSVLSQVGLAPDIMSAWELTRLSWFVDYFVRLGHHLVVLQNDLGLGMMDPLVFREGLSLKLEQTVSMPYSTCNRHYHHSPIQELKATHYERVQALSPKSVRHMINVFRFPPKRSQILHSAALLTPWVV